LIRYWQEIVDGCFLLTCSVQLLVEVQYCNWQFITDVHLAGSKAK